MIDSSPEEIQIKDTVISILDDAASGIVELESRIIRALRTQVCADFIKLGYAPEDIKTIAEHIKTYDLGLPGFCNNAHKLGPSSIPDIVRLFEANNIYDFSDADQLAFQSILVSTPDIKFIKSLIPDFKHTADSLLPYFVINEPENKFNRNFLTNVKTLNKRLRLIDSNEILETISLRELHTALITLKEDNTSWEQRIINITPNFKANFDRLFKEFDLPAIFLTEKEEP